ncbi:MAG: SRPBCC domain-containing protein [Chlorobi bacterium]|nr:SRPBCC domain-containing protein [Chlorobiota bacterium]
MKTKYELEYTVNTSPNVLFNRLSTAGGLAEWFAEDVHIKDNVFTFVWEGNEQEAKILQKKDQSYIRMHWLDDENPDTYFEFRLNRDELTGDLALLITDFAEEDEKDDAIDLWNTQISELKRNLGL